MCRNTLFLSLCSFALFIISVLKGADGDKGENADENEYLEVDDIDPKQVGKTLVSRESCEVLAKYLSSGPKNRKKKRYRYLCFRKL